MGSHPNAMLIAVLTPDDLARKTYRAMCEQFGVKDSDDGDFKIGKEDYHSLVMESNYAEGYQIAAPEGSIVLHDFLTYGYSEKLAWSEVERRKTELDDWLKVVCEKLKCSYEIFISANYW